MSRSVTSQRFATTTGAPDAQQRRQQAMHAAGTCSRVCLSELAGIRTSPARTRTRKHALLHACAQQQHCQLCCCSCATGGTQRAPHLQVDRPRGCQQARTGHAAAACHCCNPSAGCLRNGRGDPWRRAAGTARRCRDQSKGTCHAVMPPSSAARWAGCPQHPMQPHSTCRERTLQHYDGSAGVCADVRPTCSPSCCSQASKAACVSGKSPSGLSR